MTLDSFLSTVHIFISVMLVGVVLLQVKGQGGGLFGSSEGSFRTRRGLELALFRFTIILVVVFLLLSIISARPS